MHAAIINIGFAFGIDIGQRVLHPIFIIAVRKIFARMSAATFFTRIGTFNRGNGLHDEIVKFQRLNKVGIPNHRPVSNADIVHRIDHFLHALTALFQHIASAENGAVFLHGFLHFEAQFSRRRRAIGIAEALQTLNRILARIGRQRRKSCARVNDFSRAKSRGAPKDNKVNQRIGTKAIGSMHRHTCRFTDCHQAGHSA